MYPGQNKFNRYKQNLKKEISIPDIIKKDLGNCSFNKLKVFFVKAPKDLTLLIT